jgi:hypothetical protein
MLMTDLLAAVVAFFKDPITLGLAVGIFINLCTGLSAALVTKTFQAKAMIGWYTSRVLPGLIGWGMWYVLMHLGIAGITLAALPGIGDILAQVGTVMGAVTAGGAILAAIVQNLQEISAAQRAQSPPPA